MHLTIRAATVADHPIVPAILLAAMEDVIFHFIGKEDREEAIAFLAQLFKETGNLYSYENTFVAVDETGNIAGALTGYDGDRFTVLRQPVLDLMRQQYGNNLVPEPETEGKEFYLDAIAVTPAARGKGAGSLLLQHAVDYAQAKGFKQAGLLVDLENPGAQKLYERMGFRLGAAINFAGGRYYHMFISLP